MKKRFGKNTQSGRLQAATDALHRKLIVKTLREGKSMAESAKLLGIGERGLYSRMKKLGIKRCVKVLRIVNVTLVRPESN